MFYLDPENSISYAESGDGEPFNSLKELISIANAREWSKSAVTDLWNGFAGTAGPFANLKPAKMFRNRPHGLKQIWKAIQRLAPSDAATEPVAPTEAIVEEEKPMKKTKKKAAAKKKSAVKVKAPKKEGGKRDELIRLVARKNGASGQELQDALGWLSHSVRGAISTINSKGIAKIESEKHATRGRVYRIAS